MTWVCRTQFNYATQEIPAIPTDPVFSYVGLLLHGNGADAGTTFTDSSSYGKTVTRVGLTTTSTAAIKYGTASLSLVSASSCGLSIAQTGLTPFELDPFRQNTGESTYATVECWFKTSSTAANQTILCKANGAFLSGAWTLLMSNGYAGSVEFWHMNFSTGAAMMKTSVTNYADNAWHHVAVTSAGNAFTLWVDGVSVATATGPAIRAGNAQPFTVGYDSNYGRYFNGNIDDVRSTRSDVNAGGVVGTCRYTTAFTPPTAQFPDS